MKQTEMDIQKTQLGKAADEYADRRRALDRSQAELEAAAARVHAEMRKEKRRTLTSGGFQFTVTSSAEKLKIARAK